MSWDLMIMQLPDDATIETMPDHYPPIATSVDLTDTLRSLFPDIHIEGTRHAFLTGPDYNIEFSLGKDEPVTIIMLAVHGTGDALRPIAKLCHELKCRALDCDQGDIIDFDAEGY